MTWEQGGPADLRDLSAGDVTAFVLASSRTRDGSVSAVVTALRSLLRFLHVTGVIDRPLAAAVPSLASWKLAGLPKAVPAESPTKVAVRMRHGSLRTRTSWRSLTVPPIRPVAPQLLSGGAYRPTRTDATSPAPPMARMLRGGGRGGATRLKLYLSLLWLARGRQRPVFSYPAQQLAALLGLPDPDTAGTRRIQDALRWLHENSFVALDRRPGNASRVHLLDDAGSGTAYRDPGSLANKRARLAEPEPEPERERHFYVRLPREYWTNGWITHLSGAATAMYLAVLREQRGTIHEPVWISPRIGRDQYDLSDETRTKGLTELVDAELLALNADPPPRPPSTNGTEPATSTASTPAGSPASPAAPRPPHPAPVTASQTNRSDNMAPRRCHRSGAEDERRSPRDSVAILAPRLRRWTATTRPPASDPTRHYDGSPPIEGTHAGPGRVPSWPGVQQAPTGDGRRQPSGPKLCRRATVQP